MLQRADAGGCTSDAEEVCGRLSAAAIYARWRRPCRPDLNHQRRACAPRGSRCVLARKRVARSAALVPPARAAALVFMRAGAHHIAADEAAAVRRRVVSEETRVAARGAQHDGL